MSALVGATEKKKKQLSRILNIRVASLPVKRLWLSVLPGWSLEPLEAARVPKSRPLSCKAERKDAHLGAASAASPSSSCAR